MKLLTQEEIEKHYERCEFDDECDYCDNPEHGSYVKLYHEPEGVTEAEFYICGKCASISIPELKKYEAEHFKQMGDMADWYAKNIKENKQ